MLPFLKAHWLPIIGGVVGLAMGLTIFVQSNLISTLRSQLTAKGAELTVAIRTITVQTAALENSAAVINKQSKSINDLAEAAKTNREAYERANAAAKVSADRNREAAAQLLALQGPEGELEECRVARELLEKELVE